MHVPSIDPARGGDVAKLEFWGLIEEERAQARPTAAAPGTGGSRRRGEDWLNRKTAVPKYARVYDGRLLSLTGAAVTSTTPWATGSGSTT